MSEKYIMLVLGLDTSTRQASISLCSEHEVYGEYTWYSANNHSVELLGHIRDLLAQGQKTLQQLDVIAVATGPGSFNGVRVALSTAKALSFALQKPLLGVSTLDVIAAQQQHIHSPLCALLEAGRGELYAAWYLFQELRSSEGEISYNMRQLSAYLIDTPQNLATAWREHARDWSGLQATEPFPASLFCGEIGATSRQILHEQLPEHSFFVNSLQSTRRAAQLVQLALQRLSAGQQDDPRVLEPLYLRRPSITKSTRKQPLLGGII